jgi:DNA mismatch repair protein MutS
MFYEAIMEFEIDEQTRKDLSISYNKYGTSVFEFFDFTVTRGGRMELIKIIDNPSNDIDFLNERKELLTFFMERDLAFPFTYHQLEFIEHYMTKPMPLLRNNLLDAMADKIADTFTHQNDYYIISRGIELLKAHILKLKEFSDQFTMEEAPGYFKKLRLDLEEMMDKPTFRSLLNPKPNRFSKLIETNHNDWIVRKEDTDSLLKLLAYTYQIDVFVAISKAAKKKNLVFADYATSQHQEIDIVGMVHLFLKEPIANDIKISDGRNLCFVSGPNMAGKSTFLKAMGICVYLAHVGLPVPATRIKTAVYNGLYTTINLSDSTELGYSHYYSEVKRVKDVALSVQRQKRVFVIFDELFKGTNVRDAFDATLMITTAFSKIKESTFFISTHIVEVGKKLEKEEGVIYRYFDTRLVNNSPIYSYKIRDGLSFERLGMFVVQNEGIMEILNKIIQDAQEIKNLS